MKKRTIPLLAFSFFLISVIWLYGLGDLNGQANIGNNGGDYTHLMHTLILISITLLFAIIWAINEKQNNIVLQESEEKYRLLFENAIEAIMVLQDGEFKIFNPMTEKILRIDKEKLKKMKLWDVVHPDDKEKALKVHNDRLSGTQDKVKHVFRILDTNNEIILVESKGIKIMWNDRPASLTFITDITDRKKKEEDILYLSFHDQLTGAYNRRFFEEELQRIDNPRNLPLTIIMIDVDGLKIFNDVLGHKSGDELIQKVAKAVIEESRNNDIFSRIGGDEFTLLMPSTSKDEAKIFIKRLEEKIKNEKVDSLDISVSLGYETKFRKEQNVDDILKKAEEHMYKNKVNQSNEYRDNMVETIYERLSKEIGWEKEHSKQVRRILELFGKELGFEEGRIEKLKLAGYYHDIGKYFIDKKLLSKKGNLTEEEFVELKKHAESGYQILKSSKKYMPISEIVLYHHENWDGSGYPEGIKEIKIPLESRILAIAEVYDEMISDRPYKDPVTKEEAIQKIKEGSGTQFDPDLVKIFLEDIIGNI